jgi:putative restriction endonuclease
VLTAGEPFFFKTDDPHNRIVGGGFYSGFAALRISEAWELFADANGAASMEQMRQRVGRYRREPIVPGEDPEIGCVFVRDVRFLRAELGVEPPPDFAANVVQGEGHDLAGEPAAGYFAGLLEQVLGVAAGVDLAEPWQRAGPVYGDPRLTPQRLGQ